MSTADPKSAREHARAQAGTRVASQPLVPAKDHAPEGVNSQDMLWAEGLAAGGYSYRILPRGARLQLTDREGDACLSLIIFNADNPIERFNMADSQKVQWNGYLRQNMGLLSDMGRVLMTIVQDGGSAHDAFYGPSNEADNTAKYGAGDNFSAAPNARDRLALALAKNGLTRRDIHPCWNLFKDVRAGNEGGLTLNVGPYAPGRTILLRAEMNVLVAMANCAHRADPRTEYTVTPVDVRAWRGPITPDDDPIRNSSPELHRAFQNTEDYYAQ